MSTTHVAALNALSLFFHQQVVKVYTGCKVLIQDDNMAVEEDDIAPDRLSEHDLWVRFSIGVNDTKQMTVGATTNRHHSTGQCLAEIHAPLGIGTGKPTALAEFIQDKFIEGSVAGVTLLTPTILQVGKRPPWYVTTVRCPFFFSKVK